MENTKDAAPTGGLHLNRQTRNPAGDIVDRSLEANNPWTVGQLLASLGGMPHAAEVIVVASVDPKGKVAGYDIKALRHHETAGPVGAVFLVPDTHALVEVGPPPPPVPRPPAEPVDDTPDTPPNEGTE